MLLGKKVETSVAFNIFMAQDPRERSLSFQAPMDKYYEKLFHPVWVTVRRGMDTLIGQPGSGDHCYLTSYGQDTMIVATQVQMKACSLKGSKGCCYQTKKGRMLGRYKQQMSVVLIFPEDIYIMNVVFLPIYYTTFDSIKIE